MERLATILAQRFGMSAPALIRRLKEGRFCARASLDLASAEQLVGELDSLGARSSMSAEGPREPDSRRPQSGLAAAYAGDRLRDDVRLDLGALAAPDSGGSDEGWELADIESALEPRHAPPPSNHTMPMPVLRVKPAGGTPPPPSEPGVRRASPQGTGVRDRARPMVLPPRPPGWSKSDQYLPDDPLPLTEQETVPYGPNDGLPLSEQVTVQYPPGNGLPLSEQETVQFRPDQLPPARDPFMPPDQDGDTQLELAAVPDGAPPPAAPLDTPGVVRRNAPVSVAGSSSIHGTSMLARLRDAVGESARARFVAGVVVALLVGLVPAQLYSSASAATAYDDIRADLQADYDAADTPQRWTALTTARDGAMARAASRQQRLVVSACLLWLAAAGAAAFVWFRFVVPRDDEPALR